MGESLTSSAARGLWSGRAGWPRRSPTLRRRRAAGTSPGLVPRHRCQRPPAAARGGLAAQLLWLEAQVGLAGRLWPPKARGICDAARCVSARALVVPNWPLSPLRASCAGGWDYFGQAVFHFIKDVFYSLSEELWCPLDQYLLFSFNIFRSIKTLPVKYSPETHPWSAQEIF